MKKKLAPKNSEDTPSAKIGFEGELVSEKLKLEKLYLETYIDRLRPNPVPEDLEEIVQLKWIWMRKQWYLKRQIIIIT